MNEKQLTNEEIKNFFEIKVFIIESPKPEDFLNNIEEGSAIYRMLTLTGTNVEYFQVVNLKCLKKVLKTILSVKSTTKYKTVLPIIHFSLHGNERGVVLTSKENLSWKKLAQLLTPINQKLNQVLTICMSSCKGANAHKMAHDISGIPPYCALIGPQNELVWSDTLTAFVTFYNSFIKFDEFLKGIEKMNFCIGVSDEFQLFSGKKEQKKFALKRAIIMQKIKKKTGKN